MPSCVVPWCKNNSVAHKKSDGITFHKFPNKEELKNKWIDAIRSSRNEEHWVPSKFSVVCSRHFEDSLIYTTTKRGYRRLVAKNAIPIKDLFDPSRLDNKNTDPSAGFAFGPIEYHPEASTSTAGGEDIRNSLDTEECTYTPIILDSDDEPREHDEREAEQDVHCTSSNVSRNGRLWLNDAGSAGSVLPVSWAYSLQQELLMDLHQISDKIQKVYPTVLGKQFTLTFKGEDGVKNEYVFTSASETRRSGERHGGLSCDECGSEIIGFRYKCVSCADYDLCSACEALGKHAHHLMMRIAKPLKLKQARALLQRWCEAMRTAGVTTIEEITCAPGIAEPDASPSRGPVNISQEEGPTNTKLKVVKTLKSKLKASKKASTQPPNKSIEIKKIIIEDSEAKKRKIDTPEEDSRAKKRKIDTPEEDSRANKGKIDTPKENSGANKRKIDTPEEDSGTNKTKIDTPDEDSRAKKRKIVPLENSIDSNSASDILPIKEEPLDQDSTTDILLVSIKEEPLENMNLAHYSSSLADAGITVKVEDLKVEYPDPWDMAHDVVKTEEIAEDTSLATPGAMEADASSAAPGPPLTATCIETYKHMVAR